MRALVLAAGRGSRLAPFTADRPKCLVDIGGRSLLDRQVTALRAAGAEEVGVVTGWCADAFAGSGLPTFHNPDWADTTMVGSLAVAEEWLLAGPVLAGYGDIVYSANTARRLAEATEPLAISYDPDWEALWRSRFDQPLDDAETFVMDDNGHLVDIGGRPDTAAEVQGQYLGLLRFTPQAWSTVRALRSSDTHVRDLDMTGLLRHLVRNRLLPIRTVAADGPWCEFDHPSDIEVGADIVRRLDEGLVR
jgi:L-glutamine-phosphate cytidylyltransferase